MKSDVHSIWVMSADKRSSGNAGVDWAQLISPNSASCLAFEGEMAQILSVPFLSLFRPNNSKTRQVHPL